MLAAPSTPAHAAGAGAALNIREGAVAGITGGSSGGITQQWRITRTSVFVSNRACVFSMKLL